MQPFIHPTLFACKVSAGFSSPATNTSIAQELVLAHLVKNQRAGVVSVKVDQLPWAAKVSGLPLSFEQVRQAGNRIFKATAVQNRGGVGMGNTAPARVAKAQKAAKAKAAKVRGQAGTLDDLKACLWLAVTKCAVAINQGPLTDEGRKTIHCLSQVASVYIRAVEATGLESRIQALDEGR